MSGEIVTESAGTTFGVVRFSLPGSGPATGRLERVVPIGLMPHVINGPHGIAVSPLANYGLPDWLRVSVGLPEQHAALLAALRG